MTKLELLYTQKSAKFAQVCALAARELGYGELSTLSVEERIRSRRRSEAVRGTVGRDGRDEDEFRHSPNYAFTAAARRVSRHLRENPRRAGNRRRTLGLPQEGPEASAAGLTLDLRWPGAQRGSAAAGAFLPFEAIALRHSLGVKYLQSDGGRDAESPSRADHSGGVRSVALSRMGELQLLRELPRASADAPASARTIAPK